MLLNFFLNQCEQNGLLHGRTPDDVQRKPGTEVYLAPLNRAASSDGVNRRSQEGLSLSCGAERPSSFSIALSNFGTPSSLPTTHRIPIRLAACSSSSVLKSVNITIGISGKALNIPSAATRPSESGIL